MNKFCKRALSELLGLRLSTVSIKKRLEPIVDYLSRHRVALKKYIYPSCYKDVMENLWDCLLQVCVCKRGEEVGKRRGSGEEERKWGRGEEVGKRRGSGEEERKWGRGEEVGEEERR